MKQSNLWNQVLKPEWSDLIQQVPGKRPLKCTGSRQTGLRKWKPWIPLRMQKRGKKLISPTPTTQGLFRAALTTAATSTSWSGTSHQTPSIRMIPSWSTAARVYSKRSTLLVFWLSKLWDSCWTLRWPQTRLSLFCRDWWFRFGLRCAHATPKFGSMRSQLFASLRSSVAPRWTTISECSSHSLVTKWMLKMWRKMW